MPPARTAASRSTPAAAPWLYTMTNSQSLSANDRFTEDLHGHRDGRSGRPPPRTSPSRSRGTNDAPVISSAAPERRHRRGRSLDRGGDGQRQRRRPRRGAELHRRCHRHVRQLHGQRQQRRWLYTMTNSQSLSANDRFTETFTVTVTGRSGRPPPRTSPSRSPAPMTRR